MMMVRWICDVTLNDTDELRQCLELRILWGML